MDGYGLDGNLCAGLFYEHRFAMLINVWTHLAFVRSPSAALLAGTFSVEPGNVEF